MKSNNLNDTFKTFMTHLNLFEYKFTGYDKIWEVIFPINTRKWAHVYVTIYRDTYYLSELLNEYPSIEVSKEFIIKESQNGFNRHYRSSINLWVPLLNLAIEHLIKVKKSWIA